MPLAAPAEDTAVALALEKALEVRAIVADAAADRSAWQAAVAEEAPAATIADAAADRSAWRAVASEASEASAAAAEDAAAAPAVDEGDTSHDPSLLEAPGQLV